MEATSNWSPENNVKLIDVIQESARLPTGDFVDLIDEDKCVSLSRPATDLEECYIRLASRSGPASVRNVQGFKSKTKKLIIGIMLLSEARVIETFTGSHDEYCKTVHGKLMGDFEDSKIYKCEVQFNKPKDTVKLKLKATFHGNSLWVYGFHVAISVEPAIQPLTRFGSDHLSSVLKDKDVQMSKQATKFCQMLENFNSVNDASNPYIGNNPMALMSMMLGPMMSTSRSSVSNTETDGKKTYSSCSDNGHTVHAQDKSKVDSIKGSELKNSLDLFANGHYLSANIQEETQYNIENEIKKQHNLENEIKNLVIDCDNKKYKENKMMSDQSSTENGGKSKDSSLHRDNFVEKLNALISDGNHMMVDQQKFCPLVDIVLKAGTSTSKAMMHSAKGYFIKSSGITDQTCNPPQAAVDSSRKVPVMNMDQNVKLSPDDCSDSDGAWKTRGEAGSVDLSSTVHQDTALTRNLSKNNESLLNCIESLIDKKFAAMEERMMQKIEQKLSENAQIDTLKLEKIEGLLSKLHDKL
ncbi:uncharacterized protein [Procambarus clarkii]|uniref:uncharacterized protein n=1 Tax=Procambarus clarkii TaxID=6728 RepID=UPI0037448032